MAHLNIYTTGGQCFKVTGSVEQTKERADRLASMLVDLHREPSVPPSSGFPEDADRPEPATCVVRFREYQAPEVVIALDHLAGYEVHT